MNPTLPTPPKPLTKLWRVVRHIREEYEVEASSRAEALTNAEDPHTVIVTHETCTPATQGANHEPT